MFRVELSDRDFNKIEYLDKEYSNLEWDFSRIGGCGSCQFELPRQFCNELNLASDFNMKVYKRNDSLKAYELWYQGLIENKIINVRAKREMVSIRGHGYSAQLSRIYLDANFTSTEVSVIVKNILDNHVVLNTNISYNVSDIEVTSFTPNQINFNNDVKQAIQTLADLVNYEWGVDKDRKFYFKAKSEVVGNRFVLGAKCTRFFSDDSSDGIVNRVIIKGGDVSGSPFNPSPFNDISSQKKWGRRDLAVHNSAITTLEVAQQYANAIFAEKSTIVRRASAEVVDVEQRFEEATPIKLFELVSKGITYGEKRYGTFIYSGRVNYDINRISYEVDNNNVLSVSLELGVPKPSIGETIAAIEFKLNQTYSQDLS